MLATLGGRLGRRSAWWDDVFYNEGTQFDNSEWRRVFRVRRETFEDLVDEAGLDRFFA